MPVDIGWLPRRIQERVGQAVEVLATVFEAGLSTVLLVGAAATPTREDRAQAPELIVLVDTVSVSQLRQLAEQAHDVMSNGIRIRVLSTQDFQRSLDVFALEVAEWRDRHVLLAGEDPFENCQIEARDLRYSLEQASRGLGRQLKNRVLAGWATDGRRDDAERAIIDGLNRLLVIAHHSLTLCDGDAPALESELLERLAERTEISSPSPLSTLLGEVRKSGRVRKPEEALEPLLVACDATAHWLDELKVT